MASYIFTPNWTCCLLTAIVVSVLLALFSGNKTVRYYFCYTAYCLGVPLVAILHIPVFLLRPKNVENLNISGFVYKNLYKILGIEWELKNGEILAEERGAIILANHQSMLDVLGMWNIWSVMGRCTAVTKKEVFYIPFFGQAGWLAGLIYIDRSRPKQAYEIIKQRYDLIHKKKTKIWIFPEGTRNSKSETLLPFKKGAFRMAIECKAPIIPVIYSPYYFINREKRTFDKGKITMTVLEPISVDNYSMENIDELISRTYDIMNSEYSRQRTIACKNS